jgi:hypothetical protein
MSKLDLGPAGVALTVSDTYLGRAAELERLGSRELADGLLARRPSAAP